MAALVTGGVLVSTHQLDAFRERIEYGFSNQRMVFPCVALQRKTADQCDNEQTGKKTPVAYTFSGRCFKALSDHEQDSFVVHNPQVLA